MMTIEEMYEFDLRGFIVCRGLLSSTEVEIALSLTAGATVSPKDGKFSFFGSHPFFMDLMARRTTIDVLRTILGEWLRFDHAFGISMSKEIPITENLHAGPLENQGAFFYQWHGARMSNGLLKVIYVLNDVNQGDGGFICVPGSHKANMIYRPSHDSALVEQPTFKPGDALIFTEALVHGSRQWVAGIPRRVLIYSYAPGYLAWRSYDAIRPFLDQAASALQRDLLRPPFVGNYDETSVQTNGVWPKDRRTRTGGDVGSSAPRSMPGVR
jgi:hypothetical protein